MTLPFSTRVAVSTSCTALQRSLAYSLHRFFHRTRHCAGHPAMAVTKPMDDRAEDEEGTAQQKCAHKKKLHGRAFYESLGSPKFVLAPMVDQSEFAWRMLTRSFMEPENVSKLLAYTPMFHARLFAETEKYFNQSFQPTKTVSIPDNLTSPTNDHKGIHAAPYLDGNPALDRPLFVQFCANDPDILLAAAKRVASYCDAVDLNLGCPQGIARKGRYGAFLQEDWALISRLIGTLHRELTIPVTAKIRILESKEKTLDYAKMVLDAGASILTIHGRRREQKGHNTGIADWTYIRHLRDNLPPDTVIFANGNILQHDDIATCLTETGADAIMSAEGNLHDPSIFASCPQEPDPREYWRGSDGRGGYRLDAVIRRYLDIIYTHVLDQEPPKRTPLFAVGDEWEFGTRPTLQDESLDDRTEDGPLRKKRKRTRDVRSQNLLSMQSHLFSLLRSVVATRTDVRDALSQCKAGDMKAFERVLSLVEHGTSQAMIEEAKAASVAKAVPNQKAEVRQRVDHEPDVRARCRRPWFVCQPFLRPLPDEAFANGSMQMSKKQKIELVVKQHLQQEPQVVKAADVSHEEAVAG